ncbi:MAG: alcohol dehydrogenase catalytic domain-containing protein [Planctomycetota bacterium]|jgi:L-iditol 2-dehydrogenase|nr:alcohol dehydrogenase catalytic domain-containing protein [Planctomycetota bacterium]
MKAMRTVGAGQLEIVEAPIPAPGRGEVAVRMLAVGICASDVQIYHGKHKYVKFPIIQGHEGTGVVHAVGPGVSGLAPGDQVCIQQQLACGKCRACRKGRHNVCENLRGLIGIHVSGLFSEYFLCPAWNAVKLPPSLTRDQGMLAEPVSVGVNSAQTGAFRPGERALVIGAGIIGNLTAQACKAMGAAAVLVADVAEEKLSIARDNGLDAVNSGISDLGVETRRRFGDAPPDAIFDCAGADATLKQALALAPNASRVVIVANFKAPVSLEIPSFQRREITIYTVMGTVRESTTAAIDFMASGKILARDMVTVRFPLEKMADAYRYIDENPTRVMRVAIDIGG